jgi:hypothetical protein
MDWRTSSAKACISASMVVLLALAIVGFLPRFQNFYWRVVKFGFGVDRHQYHFAIG